MVWLTWIASNIALAALVAVAAWFVQHRLHRPGVARWLWVLVFLKLVTPPLVKVPLVELPAAMACVLGTCHCAHEGGLSCVGTVLPWVLLGIWTAGAGATLLVALQRWRALNAVIAQAAPTPQKWQALANQLSSQLSLRRTPAILAIPGRLPPLVLPGWRQPRVLLPRDLLDQLPPAQRQTLLLHELLHIRRGDHLVRLLELACSAVFWWLPPVRLIGRQLRACEETCCDAGVVAHLPQARRDYARLLLDVLDFADPLPRQAPPVTAMSAADDLERRLRDILINTARRQSRRPILVLAIAILIMPCGLTCEFGAREPVEGPAAASATEAMSNVKMLRFVGCEAPPQLQAYTCPQ